MSNGVSGNRPSLQQLPARPDAQLTTRSTQADAKQAKDHQTLEKKLANAEKASDSKAAYQKYYEGHDAYDTSPKAEADLKGLLHEQGHEGKKAAQEYKNELARFQRKYGTDGNNFHKPQPAVRKEKDGKTSAEPQMASRGPGKSAAEGLKELDERATSDGVPSSTEEKPKKSFLGRAADGFKKTFGSTSEAKTNPYHDRNSVAYKDAEAKYGDGSGLGGLPDDVRDKLAASWDKEHAVDSKPMSTAHAPDTQARTPATAEKTAAKGLGDDPLMKAIRQEKEFFADKAKEGQKIFLGLPFELPRPRGAPQRPTKTMEGAAAESTSLPSLTPAGLSTLGKTPKPERPKSPVTTLFAEFRDVSAKCDNLAGLSGKDRATVFHELAALDEKLQKLEGKDSLAGAIRDAIRQEPLYKEAREYQTLNSTASLPWG